MSYKVEEEETMRDWSLTSEDELAEGYREMAADKEREAQASEWCEVLIGDALETRTWR